MGAKKNIETQPELALGLGLFEVLFIENHQSNMKNKKVEQILSYLI